MITDIRIADQSNAGGTRVFVVLMALAWLVLLPARAGASETGDIRLVTLAPHLTELVYAVGAHDLLVGVVEWSDYPEAARELPRIGDAFRFDLERILGLEATHALTWRGGTPPDAVTRLESLGIQVVEIQIRNLEDIARALEAIGEFLERPLRAESAAVEFRGRLRAMREAAADGPEAVIFYQVSERPLYTLAGRHVISEVMRLCRARNLFADLDTEALVVELESVLAADPDALVAGRESERHEPLAHWHRHDSLRAIRCGRLWTVDPELLVRPTPRILDGAERLCDWLGGIRQAQDPACEIGRE